MVGSLASGLDRLAAGDLTVPPRTRSFPGDYEKLRDDFNAAVGKLEKAMSAIASSTAAIRSGGGEIAHAADDLSRRTEHQAATLEETAAALDEITATVQRGPPRAPTPGREAVRRRQDRAPSAGDVVGGRGARRHERDRTLVHARSARSSA